MSSGNGTRILVRSRKGRMAAGVCAGAAEYFGSRPDAYSQAGVRI